jgi:hypothetical protein
LTGGFNSKRSLMPLLSIESQVLFGAKSTVKKAVKYTPFFQLQQFYLFF